MTNPQDYSVSNKVQKYNILPIIEEFSEDLVNICGKCMDIGCGPGDITKDLLLPLLGPNVEIIGTDISESMIEYANKTFGDRKRLQFEVLDAATENLPKKYISEFDHIFSFHALHWCNDIRQAFKNIYQMLRPKGTILFYISAFNDMFDVLKMMAQDIRFAQYIPDAMRNVAPYHKSNNPRKELKESLESVGFTVHHCSLRETSYSEEKSEQFLKSVLSILAFLEDMPGDLIIQYKDELIHEYMKRKIRYRPINNNQELTLDLYKGLVVYAQKM
ncbi:PREDICTED: uncharacterized methyltransferase C70.08c-like [Vollenhovia emeryi]|uniref:uncharacterized methyltransferase C70.08c-like n=1 Tax=Vollenhovia emeryi TaxID=411798 RepID=UPI0005F39CDD|nr:PREDICTED: uncharacterized methyltransferase C70.08c-like [Vollenhovia emeryi]